MFSQFPISSGPLASSSESAATGSAGGWFRASWFSSAQFASAWWGGLGTDEGSPQGSPVEPPAEPPQFVAFGPGYQIILPVSLQRQRLDEDELFIFLVGSMLTQGLLK